VNQIQGKEGHSHRLAEKYKRVSETKIDTRGDEYELPTFKEADKPSLAGKRVLIISADGPELPELHIPLEYLKARGAQVELAGQKWIFQFRWPNDGSTGKVGNIVIAEFLADDIYVQADLSLYDANVDNYDAIFIPGGAWNPDMLRTDEDALRVVSEARKKGKLIVSLCHGPQVLINADRDGKKRNALFPAGTKITGVSSIRVDLENAGFTVLDQATVYDETCRLLTAPSPKELGALCEEMGRLLATNDN
jgi:protease I